MKEKSKQNENAKSAIDTFAILKKNLIEQYFDTF